MAAAVATLAVATTIGQPVAAQGPSAIYATDLAKCMVAKTSDADKVAMVRWIFVAMAAHPEVARLARVDAAARTGENAAMATLVDRLLTTDCRAQTVAALKYEGRTALQTSFGVLGQVAMRTLVEDSAVDAAFGGFATGLDEKRLGAVFAEAGINAPAKPGQSQPAHAKPPAVPAPPAK